MSTSGGAKSGKTDSSWNDGVASLLDDHGSVQLTSDELINALIDPMIDEAARCLEEGIVEDAESVDLAMVMGTGFPPFRGGLLRYADAVGLPMIVDRIKQSQLSREPSNLLSELALRGATFHGSQSEQSVDRIVS